MLRKSPGGARMGAVSPPSAAQSSARSVRAVVAGALLVAALGAAPRALALAAIGYAAPHAPLPQALFDVKSTWGACKKPGAVFTGYSPGGQLYRWLILTDHCFYSLGLTVAYLGGLHALFPAKTHDAREAPAQPFGVRLWRGLRRLFCLLGVINFCVWMAIDAQLYRGDMTNAQVCARALACGCHRLISGRASLHAPQQCLQQCFLALIHRLLARIQVELSHGILDVPVQRRGPVRCGVFRPNDQSSCLASGSGTEITACHVLSAGPVLFLFLLHHCPQLLLLLDPEWAPRQTVTRAR